MYQILVVAIYDYNRTVGLLSQSVVMNWDRTPQNLNMKLQVREL